MKKIFSILLLTFNLAFAVEYTYEDRDRIIKLETKVEEGFKHVDKQFENVGKQFEQVNKRFEQVDKRFDELRDFMMWGFGILFGGMGLMIGFVIWDRRTAVAPVANEIKELKERETRLENLIKDIINTTPQMQDIARKHGYIL